MEHDIIAKKMNCNVYGVFTFVSATSRNDEPAA